MAATDRAIGAKFNDVWGVEFMNLDTQHPTFRYGSEMDTKEKAEGYAAGWNRCLDAVAAELLRKTIGAKSSC